MLHVDIYSSHAVSCEPVLVKGGGNICTLLISVEAEAACCETEVAGGEMNLIVASNPC